MKKLLYLVPVILIALNFLPFAIYKDEVDYGKSLDTATPFHWTILNTQISSSGSLNIDPLGVTTEEKEIVSDNASFRGFPFGAYLDKSKTSSSSSSSGSYNISAYSWLWLLIDTALVGLAVALVVKAIRTPSKPSHN